MLTFQNMSNIFFDSKLSFFDHINEKIKKATKGVNVIRKMNLLLPRSSLLTIYKSFVRPHLDCSDVIYDQPNNSRLSDIWRYLRNLRREIISRGRT